MALSSKCKHTYCRHQAHFAGLVGGCKSQTAEVAEFHRLLHPVSGGGGEVRTTGFDSMFMYVFNFHTMFSIDISCLVDSTDSIPTIRLSA